MWQKAFALTLLFEVPIYLFVARFREEDTRKVPLRKILLAAIVCSSVTHPFFWFVWRLVISDYALYVLTGEAIVVVVEVFLFYAIARPVTLLRASACALSANAASYGLGILCYRLGVV